MWEALCLDPQKALLVQYMSAYAPHLPKHWSTMMTGMVATHTKKLNSSIRQLDNGSGRNLKGTCDKVASECFFFLSTVRSKNPNIFVY